ncbi:MAG: nucleotide sugar dehydrogenase [Candidatus Levybacteria bacterium]|nr:nucleotide sugar dehydrogenase [Candidatus Levybacteria bacterium]
MSKQICVAVVGIGRVGLPFALVLSEVGFKVYGIGRDAKKIEKLQAGEMPFMEKGGDVLLKKHINKNFLPTVDYSKVKESDYIVLTLGTPVDENMNPVFDQINKVCSSIAPYVRKNQTLILRSTVSPRTTDYVKLFLNDLPGIKVGENFFLAFCPERISEGFAIEEIKSVPQIVGGVDKKSTKKASEFFEKVGTTVIATDDTSAELAKLFTNMYRYINFAIANEFMVLADNYNRDIYEIVNLVNYKYKRGGLNLPGLTGGPCLFKDGFFLISDLPFADLISTSWKINESVPLLLVKRVRERMKLEGKKAVILGLAFKSEIDDIRESLSFKVRKALLRERAKVILHDPYVKDYKHQEIEKNLEKAITDADVVFIAANHRIYKNLDINKFKKLVKKDCIICDVWNVLSTDKIVFTVNQLYQINNKNGNL